MKNYYTKHLLTNSMLQRMSAMHRGMAHKFGTSLQALERRGTDRERLIKPRIPQCPDCGGKTVESEVLVSRQGYKNETDALLCQHCHNTNMRRKWCDGYGFEFMLTKVGKQALADARKEGW